jgi:hypothetical protein
MKTIRKPAVIAVLFALILSSSCATEEAVICQDFGTKDLPGKFILNDGRVFYIYDENLNYRSENDLVLISNRFDGKPVVSIPCQDVAFIESVQNYKRKKALSYAGGLLVVILGSLLFY